MSINANILGVLGSIYPPLIEEDKLADRMYPLTEVYSWLVQETGYMHIQSTKPDTVGLYNFYIHKNNS